MPERAKLGWVIVYVPDVTASLAFYGATFGLATRFVTPDGSYGELDTGQTTLSFASEELGDGNLPEGFARPATTGPPGNVELALVFDDVDAAFAHAVAEGCEALAPPADKPQGQRVAYVRDPFGTLLELASPLG